MSAPRLFCTSALLATLILAPTAASAQGTAADYERANSLRSKYEGLTSNVPGPASWIEKTSRFWYRKSVKGGNQFVVYDAETKQKRPAFDHERLAASLSAATGSKYTAATLPFNTIGFADNERTLDVTFDGAGWTCGLTDYACKKVEPGERGPGGGRGGAPSQGRRAEDTRPRVSPDKKWEALINNDKDFDLLYIPGAGHGPGGAYGEHKRFDFFVRHLLGVGPPEWSTVEVKAATADQEP